MPAAFLKAETAPPLATHTTGGGGLPRSPERLCKAAAHSPGLIDLQVIPTWSETWAGQLPSQARLPSLEILVAVIVEPSLSIPKPLSKSWCILANTLT